MAQAPVSRTVTHHSPSPEPPGSKRGIAQYDGATSPETMPPKTTASPSAGPAKHQRFALADPVAFRYLADDRSTTVLERRKELQGYQCYVVEQWACSRRDPTLVIIAYTGNPAHSIKVDVLSVPGSEDAWSPELKMYFKALTKLHARRRDTAAGSLMVTNLSGFPSSLTLVQVPDGDLTKHREIFYVNENLKRLGCAGRAGLSLAEPSVPTRAKFYQIYKVSEKINLFNAIVEIVKLCQAALVLFGQLEPEYADGLLCDVTERAIADWLADIGMPLYNVDPSDGVLGPTTIAALLGTLIGARNRIDSLGGPVLKDVFDLGTTKKAISWFQKTYKVTPKTRRLDRQTLDRLHKMTAKQASGHSWTVPTAVKSTVVELSGRGGEMVLDMVGRGDKTTIADIETVDYDRFIQLVKGERAKWLWHGKARKRTTRDVFSETVGSEVATFRDEHEDDAEMPSKRDSLTRKLPPKQRSASYEEPKQQLKQGSMDSTEDGLRRSGVFSATKGRLKDAVRKTHKRSSSKDSLNPYKDKEFSQSMESVGSGVSTGAPPSPAEHNFRHSGFFELHRRKDDHRHFTRHGRDFGGKGSKRASVERYNEQDMTCDFGEEIHPQLRMMCPSRDDYLPTAELDLLDIDRIDQDIGPYLRRRHSFGEYEDQYRYSTHPPHDERWPRQLSFSVIEDPLRHSIHLVDEASPNDEPAYPNTRYEMELELLRATSLSRTRSALATLQHRKLPSISQSVNAVAHLHLMASEDNDQLTAVFRPRRADYSALQSATSTLTQQERHLLSDAVKEVETLKAKLEYEIQALQSKVEDVEGAVSEFEGQVKWTEGRVTELIRSKGGGGGEERRREGWVAWGYGLVLRAGRRVEKRE